MKAFTISAGLALLTSLVSAAPASGSGPYTISVTFLGAAQGQFTQGFQSNGYGSSIYNELSVSKINNPNYGGPTCYFFGVDGAITIVPGGSTVDVGPPQRLSYGYCHSS